MILISYVRNNPSPVFEAILFFSPEASRSGSMMEPDDR
jgi:hypothetical protein